MSENETKLETQTFWALTASEPEYKITSVEGLYYDRMAVTLDNGQEYLLKGRLCLDVANLAIKYGFTDKDEIIGCRLVKSKSLSGAEPWIYKPFPNPDWKKHVA